VTLPFEPTGFKQEVTPEELSNRYPGLPEYDPRSGNHCWIITPVYKINPTKWPADDQVHLDKENLMTIAGPACLFCEQGYSKYLANRRCPGEPTQ
jgi:hypothetical protein